MIAELCIDVINSFKQIRNDLDRVCNCICDLDHNLPAWYQPPAQLNSMSTNTRQQICELLCQLEYVDGQEPRQILVGAGIVAASKATLEALESLNLSKNKFKNSMLKLKAAKIATSHELLADNFEKLLQSRDAGVATNLARMGLARLHLKQCYRKIPYFMQRPKKIAWTWANTRSIKQISALDAKEMLIKQHRDAGIERQLRLLDGIDPQEKLAIIQELAPHLRANLVFQKQAADQRVMVKGPVPIFYLVEDDNSLPEFTPPKSKSGKNQSRMIRSDVKINPEPFLPAIRAHRYYGVGIAGKDLEVSV